MTDKAVSKKKSITYKDLHTGPLVLFWTFYISTFVEKLEWIHSLKHELAFPAGSPKQAQQGFEKVKMLLQTQTADKDLKDTKK